MVAMVVQFLLSLSLLIILHEFGHFLPARWFKTRVEKFFLFFDYPGKLFSKKIGDTEWGIGMLPLGGYVKISGMVDESMDTEALKLPPKDYEFRSKKAWQRLIIMLGGVTVNFLLGFFIFGMLFWQYGESYVSAEKQPFGIIADSLGKLIGLQTSDKILKVGDAPFTKLNSQDLLKGILFGNSKTIEVERNGVNKVIDLPSDVLLTLSKYSNKGKDLFLVPDPFKIGMVNKNSQADKGGVKEGDAVLYINGEPAQYFSLFQRVAQKYKAQETTWRVKRNNDTLNLKVTSDSKGKFGFVAASEVEKFYDIKRNNYSLAQAIPLGFHRGMSFLSDQVSGMGKLFTGEIKAKESMGGFISIAENYGKTWDWERFWVITGSLSLVLAFMNLLPIPALDGGYVVFLLWEIVTGKKVSDKFLERAVTVGFFLLLALILSVNGLDIIRKIFG